MVIYTIIDINKTISLLSEVKNYMTWLKSYKYKIWLKIILKLMK
ncbi:hypothetical protein CNEO4_1800002 [Clostridium neonatale]|uniref:Uncharacterized protein n=1 Tax=Clostridium neonatale TaxID=137838 RepID=A0AA86JKU0_9CLOT|nr:hypothetical protein CNEO_40252 [Clostridium neonatale]CAG9712643.1 hypothetical protein CNEO_1720069 [Clostridium neonatale]CAG9713643.1 hypothetical protein CNEO_570016 [Clostridium neonatale]CAI3192163.1 hypothetical protein CNEO2_100102 [Clostridium neonatale]CAI3195936.1 hypothetical protein CNEO2_130005 [Clostridium neonatale]